MAHILNQSQHKSSPQQEQQQKVQLQWQSKILRPHPTSARTLTYALPYACEGEKKTPLWNRLFLQHLGNLAGGTAGQ